MKEQLYKKIISKQDELIKHLRFQPQTANTNNAFIIYWKKTNHLERELAQLKAEEQEKDVSDEDIEKYFTSQHYDNKNGNHYRINKDRIFGAKAMRDGKIKPTETI